MGLSWSEKIYVAALEKAYDCKCNTSNHLFWNVGIYFFSPEYKDPFDLDINSESVLNECIMLFLSGPTGSTLICLSTL